MELMYSTRSVGVFLLPLADPAADRPARSLLGPMRSTTLVLVAGLFVAPLAATFVRVTDAVYRALEFLPFVVLLSGVGVDYLWSVRWPPPRRAAPLAIGGGGAGTRCRVCRDAR
jgi:di/tricarboxylate transporter